MATWQVTTSNNSLTMTRMSFNSCAKIDDNHFINFHGGASAVLGAQVFTVNTSTWAVTTASSLYTDDLSTIGNSCGKIDDNHFINFFSEGNSNKGYVKVFTVNTTTWAVTTGAVFEFDTRNNSFNSCFKVDTNHFINFWQGNGDDGFTQIFTINTTTWAVTTANSRLEFDTRNNSFNSCFQIDATHFINFWLGGAATTDGYTQVFTVNTTTWAVTTSNASLLFFTDTGSYNSCFQIDSNHFINFFTGTDADGYAQVFTVNTTTWAVTTAGDPLEFDTQNNLYNSCFQIDANHFINYWAGVDLDGFVQTFTVNTSTWAITANSSPLEFDTGAGYVNSCFKVDTNHFINFWLGGDFTNGYAQIFQVELPVSSNIKTYNTNVRANIKTINTNPIANVKSLNTNV
jgi:hypothetical protein